MPSKYKNVPTEVDGIRFDSKREAARYGELKMMERSKIIRDLRLQVPFVIMVNRVRDNVPQAVAKYIADFVYFDLDGRQVVEDSKGVRTSVYKLKQKLVEAQYGIRILET